MNGVAQWIFGLSMALLNCFLSSLGLTLQRLSSLRESREKDEQVRSGLEATDVQPPKISNCMLWWVGVGLYVVAAVPDFVSYLYVPMIVPTAVACFRLVVVNILAERVLEETLPLYRKIAIGVCAVGTFMCLQFGPESMGLAAMTDAMDHPEVTIYLCVGTAAVVALCVFDHIDDFRKCSYSARCRFLILPFTIGLAFAVGKVCNAMVRVVWHSSHIDSVALVSAVGALALVDFYLNLRATKLLQPQLFLPVAFVAANTLQLTQSVVLFDEFNGLAPLSVGLSTTGACISLLGAVCIQLPEGCCRPAKRSLQSQHGTSLVGDLDGTLSIATESVLSEDQSRVA